MASQNNNTASSYCCIRYGDKDCPKLCFADPEAVFNRISKSNTHGQGTCPAKGTISIILTLYFVLFNLFIYLFYLFLILLFILFIYLFYDMNI